MKKTLIMKKALIILSIVQTLNFIWVLSWALSLDNISLPILLYNAFVLGFIYSGTFMCYLEK